MPSLCSVVSIAESLAFDDSTCLPHFFNGHSEEASETFTLIWQPHSVHRLLVCSQLGQTMQISILICFISLPTNLLINTSLLALVRLFAVSIETGTPIILGGERGNLITLRNRSLFKRVIRVHALGALWAVSVKLSGHAPSASTKSGTSLNKI